MSHREDFYSKEQLTLINKSKRELANGIEKEPIHKLRLMCFTKGATGILGLARIFREMDENGNKTLNFNEFMDGIRKSGFDCKEDEAKTMFDNIDVNKNGAISMTEFLDKLRPAMNRARLNVINRAFEKVDHDDDGVIALKDLKKVYCVRDHPKYLSGDLTESEILCEFLNNFERDGNNNNNIEDGTVTKEEFVNYYSTVSASIDNDAYFDLVMRRAYKL
ncbi:hypothetical protein DOY81_008945 [Sarcophaga bullata]|nr:hypothetical protein DOY81_008945 [Sarcophaga bullata]